MRNRDVTIWIHTSSPSPYRRHLLEKISAEFPNTKVFFSLNMKHEWYRYRSWKNDLETWNVQSVTLNNRIPLPLPFAYLNPGLIFHLLKQPNNTIHLVGSVHANWLLIMLSCMFFKGKYVLWNDSGFPDRIQGIKKSRWYRYCRKHVAAAFTPGQHGRMFTSYLGIPENRIFNAYFSHDMDDYTAFFRAKYEVGRKRIRHKINIRSEQKVILCVSRYLNLKRLVDLADALILLEQQHPSLAQDLCFILIGDGEDLEHIEKLKLLQKIHVHCEAKIPYNAMKDWYCASDIFAFPSEGDIWGLVVNEALSLGVPVICTDKIGASDLVKDRWNGYIIKPRNPEMLMDRLVKLANNSELLSSMKRNAATIHSSWNSDLAVSELKKLIRFIQKYN